MMKNCGECKHFKATEYVNWGYCEAPVPAWTNCYESNQTNVVWKLADHGSNYAEICELFDATEA